MSNYRGERGGKLSIATVSTPTPDPDAPLAQGTDLTQVAFEGLTWTEIEGIGGSLGHFAPTEEIITYALMDGTTAKAKGPRDSGTLELEYARDTTDDGQVALRIASKTNLAYAFKRELNDSPDGVMTNTIQYTRALVQETQTQAGSASDFVRETTTLNAVQDPIVVDPA